MASSEQVNSITLENISVEYGQVNAVSGISIAFHKGEIHTIIGEHGAGKSSLAKVISGFLKPSKGKIIIGNTVYDHLTFDTARNNNICIVHQYNPFFNDFSIKDYFFINNSKSDSFIIHESKLNEIIRNHFGKYDIKLNPNILLRDLKLSDRILIDILRNAHQEPSILILDESLERLTLENFNMIIEILKTFRNHGSTIIIITHKIDYIYDTADRVTVFRDGKILLTDNISNIDKINLVQLAYTNTRSDYSFENNFFKLLKYDEAILRKLPLNLLVIDNQNRIRIINESVKTLFGSESSELLDQDIEVVFNNEKELNDLIRESLDEKKACSKFSLPLKINSQELVGKVNTLPIFDGKDFIGLIIMIEDITEQESLKQQLVLSQNLASLGLLAAGVAHEINNPLNIISYHLVDLMYNTTKKERLENIRGIEEEIKSISDIVGNLLSFSDNTKFKSEQFNFVLLIHKLLSIIKYTAANNKINIHLVSGFEDITLSANRTELKQVILNIIRNSFDAMPGGGDLVIELKINDKQAGYFQVIFTDSGKGINQEILDNMFLPFFSTKNNEANHMGLGLAVTYNIVKKHQGHITARNLVKGCEVCVSLPFLSYAAKPEDIPQPPETSDGRRK